MGIALLPGQEHTEVTEDGRIHYAYRTERGEYYSCICRTLDEAHSLCESWMLNAERH